MNDTIEKIKAVVDTIICEVKPRVPLEIIDVTKSEFNYLSLIPYIISSITLYVLLRDRWIKPKIFGKILSNTRTYKQKFEYTGYDNIQKEINGEGNFCKVVIGVYKKDLSFKDVYVYAKYESENKRIKCESYWVNDEIIKWKNGKEAKVILPSDQFLFYNNLIEKNKVSIFYLRFIIPNKLNMIPFDSLDIEFRTPKNKLRSVNVKLIDEKLAFYDTTIHQEIEN